MKNTLFKLILLFPMIIFSQTIDPIYITLNGDITDPDQEISGLTWYKDNLILLPQFPNKQIYTIPKSHILEYLDSTRTTIFPNEIKWNDNRIGWSLCGFEGYEAIIFDDDTVFVSIETEYASANSGYIARGMIDNNGIKIDRKSLKKINTPVMLSNMTYETLILHADSVIAIYEVNSTKVNPEPSYFQFDKNLKSYISRSFPDVNYRITDATELDHENKFWAINYFWTGDFELLKLNEDGIAKDTIEPVERLLEFQIVDGLIVRTDRKPIDIKLDEFGGSRNWEGIVRLDDSGFLIVTDKFPGTILAYVPLPN